MPRNHHQDPGSELVRILRGPRPPSAATASAWQTKATGGWSSDSGSFVKTFSVGSPQRASTGNSGNRHRKGVENQGINGAEDTEEMSSLQVALDKAQRQAAVPPVDHQIKATEDFIERAKKRLIRHDVSSTRHRRRCRKRNL